MTGNTMAKRMTGNTKQFVSELFTKIPTKTSQPAVD
jgi:hypothetical protein